MRNVSERFLFSAMITRDMSRPMYCIMSNSRVPIHLASPQGASTTDLIEYSLIIRGISDLILVVCSKDEPTPLFDR